MMGFIRMMVYTSALLMSCVWRPSRTFILDSPSQCVVAPPCTCSRNVLVCNSKSLTAVPTIMPLSNSTSSTLYIYLFFNQISTISANVFRNLSSANATSITLRLDSNIITTISDHAFNGIENETTELQLPNNKLTSIPSAIGHLVNLQYLNLQNNPLQTFDAHVMANIYRSLHTLLISLGNMTSWPDGIHILGELRYLYIDHVNLRSLPVDSFHGFAVSLQMLTLTYTNLEQLPEALCNLKHLRTFTFSHNSMFNGNISLHNLCHEPLTEVTTLKLENDNIQTLPNEIFAIFPHLQSLVLSNNKLRYITSESVPVNNQIIVLHLSNNLLCGIPSAVNRFQRLQHLYMYGNHIVSIEQYDFVGLFQLAVLDLHSNPLEYIDPVAFTKQNNTLSALHLDHTPLETIPLAVTSLSRLSALYAETLPSIKCSCDKMSYLRSWNVTRINIYGNCELTNEPIKDYILTTLPHCPFE